MATNDITAAEVREFLDPWSFARPRNKIGATKTADGKAIPLFGESKLMTTNLSQSVKVLGATYTRLKTMTTNLESIKKFADEAALNSKSAKRDENYAKIRSLVAGVDILVDQSRFDNQRLLDGSKSTFVATMSGKTEQPKLANLLTFGEGSLELSQYKDVGRVMLDFSEGTEMLNANQNLGLNVISAVYSEPTDSEDELKDDDYRIKVSYEGAHSKVSITDQALHPIKTIEDVDLTGNGTTDVDFGNGVKITIDKTTAFSPRGFDKWDYETYGPADVFADVKYAQVSQQSLLVDSGENLIKEVSMKSQSSVSTSDGGVLSMVSPEYVRSSSVTDELKDGVYSVKVNYYGDNSSAMLRDSSGRLVKFLSGLDLSVEGTNPIDFGNGLTVNIKNDGVGSLPEQLSGSIEVVSVKQSSRLEPELDEDSVVDDSSANGTISITTLEAGLRPSSDKALAKGTYSLELRYLGESSVALIRDSRGNLMDFVSGLDLSASGDNSVDLGNGVKLTVDNNDFGNGTGVLTAKFTVKEKPRESNNENQDTSAKAKFTSSGTLTDSDGGTVKISNFTTSAVNTDVTELEGGKYSIKATYFGKNSIVALHDEDGKRIKYSAPVDLSIQGQSTVDFGNGLSFVFNNNGYSDWGHTFEAKGEYSPEKTGLSATFDFAAYAKQTEQALEIVKAQMAIIDETEYQINNQKLVQDKLKQVSQSSGAMRGASTIQLLSSGVDSATSSIFQSGGMNSQTVANIQYIIATAGTSQEPRFTTADIVASAANLSQDSVFGILSGKTSSSLFG